MAKQESSNLEFLESAEGLANEIGKVQSFFEKNRTIILGVGGSILAIALLFVGYKWYSASQDEEGQALLYKSVAKFESDSLKQALSGSNSVVNIADEYGSSAAGNLASFYAGVALLREGKYDDAISRLESFSSSDLLVQARAYSLIGDAYMEKNNAEEAVNFYKKAASYKPNKFFTPAYLIKLATAHEKAKQLNEAVEVYTKIIAEYPQTQESVLAKKYKAKTEAEIGG